MYVQYSEKKICTMVSNDLPFQVSAEYPKNCMTNLTAQKMASPMATFFPSGVCTISVEEVRHKRPIKNMPKAIKNAWIYIN